MTIFFPFSEDRTPPGSFVQRVPLPTAQPGAERLIRVCFNDQWLSLIIGCLFQLTMNTTWKVGTEDELQNALQTANDLIFLFQQAKACTPDLVGSAGADTELMIRQSPDNPCLLQSSIDGVTWCTFADLSKCMVNPTQPGSGSPVPKPGGCEDYEFVLDAGGSFLIPAVVNTGDTITLVDARGATNDIQNGTEWLCPNGQQFFAGTCIGSVEINGAAKMPTAPFMSPIAFIQGVYYDLSTPLTVPSGVVNQLAEIQVNGVVGDSFFGSLSVLIAVCNNQAAQWEHVLNFALNPSGWAVIPSECGTYTAGIGFVSTHDATLCVNDDSCEIQFTLPTVVGTYVGWEVSFTNAVAPTFTNIIAPAGTFSPTIGSGSQVVAYPNAINAGDLLQIEILQRPFTGTGQFVVAAVKFTGTGDDPF
jgi:hypothetical protein